MSKFKNTIIKLIATDYLDVTVFENNNEECIQEIYELPLTWIEEALEAAYEAGKNGGISHCQGTKFVCNDESLSRSKKVWSG